MATSKAVIGSASTAMAAPSLPSMAGLYLHMRGLRDWEKLTRDWEIYVGKKGRAGGGGALLIFKAAGVRLHDYYDMQAWLGGGLGGGVGGAAAGAVTPFTQIGRGVVGAASSVIALPASVLD